MDANEASRRRDELFLLDVREDDEWNAGHVPGAVHIPMRELGPRQAELVVAQPTGFGEVATLTVIADEVDGGTLVLDGARAQLQRSPSAKDVHDVRRRFRLDGDALHCDLWMTFGGHEDEHHLHSVLHRA